MPSPIAAVKLIETAMRKIGVKSTGQTLTADEVTDGLQCLNDVLESWSIEGLTVYGALPETFATVAGQATYTIGAGGDWDTPRPAMLTGLYTTVDGVDFPAADWSLEAYSAVGIKAMRQSIVERYVFINDDPLARVILYPTPSRGVPIVINAPRVLTQVPNPATVLVFPPGYMRALQYAVGEEYSSEFGSPIDVSAKARSTKALIKRANRTSRTMSFDPTVVRGGAGSSIYGW